jgi:HSP20 family molecular chaperone IbpA
MQCPGRMKSDIAIAIENDILTVSAPAVSMKREGRTTYEGFTLPALKKSFNLGKNVDTSHIDAKLENGILILTLQKAATVKPRTIEVL